MGTGVAVGDDRAAEAAQTAISSPLLEDNSIDGATGVLINITASSEVGIQEIQHASSIIQSAVHDDAEIIFGWVEDETIGEEIMITVIATGFGREHGGRSGAPVKAVRGDRKSDVEVPAFVRKAEPEQTTERTRRPVALIEEEEFEVPAFLRRQAD
jgi:cell division protein FtsZ